MQRIKTRVINIGGVKIGGDNPVAVQSMLARPAEDIPANILQARELVDAGCKIIRVAVPTLEDTRLITELKNSVDVPIVADIHFNYRIALAAVDAGADKIRINPGNIGSEERIKEVTDKCKGAGVPIRVGVNGGSLEKDILARYQKPTAEALFESARKNLELLEKFGFYDFAVSLKSSNVQTMVAANRMASHNFGCPLHLGVTEAGTPAMGTVLSSIGIGSLLVDGIGDTIRVSLTANPVEEIPVAYRILKASGRLTGGVKIVACPTCGRTKIDLINLANKVEAATEKIEKDITVAVMGCVVNGPGEAREADIGIAGGIGEAILFKKGEVIKKVKEDEILSLLLEEIDKL